MALCSLLVEARDFRCIHHFDPLEVAMDEGKCLSNVTLEE